jgi:hypothetical protein
MISEPIETYTKDNFDHDGHIAVFLHTSAGYLGVADDDHGVPHEASDIHYEEA